MSHSHRMDQSRFRREPKSNPQSIKSSNKNIPDFHGLRNYDVIELYVMIMSHRSQNYS